MHDAIVSAALARLAELTPLTPRPDAGGLWVVPLTALTPLARPALSPLPAVAFSEAVPPRAGAVRAAVAGTLPARVDRGVVLRGGMADRVVLRSTAIPVPGPVEVPVEALSGRWWDEGDLWLEPGVDATAAALTALAAGASDAGLRSRARVALAEVAGRRDEAGRDAIAVGGWLLGRRDAVLAAGVGDLVLLAPASPGDPEPAPRTAGGHGADPSAWRVDGTGAHAVAVDVGLRTVVVVRAGGELLDALLEMG